METSQNLVLGSKKRMSGRLRMIFFKGCHHFPFRKLIEEVSVVFHSAATIKFDEDLTKAVNLNVVAVFTITNICKKMKKLQVVCFH